MKGTDPTKKSQVQQIINYMLKGNKIDQMKAVKLFGCFRLSARFWDIKRMKRYNLKTEKVTRNNKTFSVYWIQL